MLIRSDGFRMKHIASRDAGENAGTCEASKPSREAVPRPSETGRARVAGDPKSRSQVEIGYRARGA